MALLEKAKDANSDKESDSKHKKKKHPAASVDKAESPQQDDSQGADEASDDAGQGEVGQDPSPAVAGGQEDAGDEAGQGQDQPGDQGQPQQGAQQGGAQGATPIPNPQAPGAGDDTSGGDDTPDNQDAATGGTPNDQAPTPAGAPSAMGGEGGATMANIPMPPGLKDAYQRADKELVHQLYQNGVAEHILPSLAQDPEHKAKSVIMASVVLAREVILKTKTPVQLALPLARDAAAHVLQLAEQVKQIQYNDQEMHQIIAGTMEGILHAFGIKKSNVHALMAAMPRGQVAQHAQAYVKGAPQPASPAGQPAGPQAPQGAGPQGGTLSQGAAASDGSSQPEQGSADGSSQPEQGAAQPQEQGNG